MLKIVRISGGPFSNPYPKHLKNPKWVHLIVEIKSTHNRLNISTI